MTQRLFVRSVLVSVFLSVGACVDDGPPPPAGSDAAAADAAADDTSGAGGTAGATTTGGTAGTTTTGGTGGTTMTGGAAGDAGAAQVPPDGAPGVDGAPPVDALTPDAAPTAPVTRRLFPGRAQLVGEHLSACSHQEPASGDGARWCAVTRPAAQLGKSELWVVNVTRALAADVKCDGTDPACLRLTTDLWTGVTDAGPTHPTGHRFDGDTLIFFADAPASQETYSGPIFAWRPGWPQARRITGPRGHDCSGHLRTDVVLCLENLSPSHQLPLQVDLTAGRPGAAPLPTIARITPMHPNTDASQWRSAFSDDGAFLAFSTGGVNASQRETLYVVKTDEIGVADRLTTVATDVSRWRISRDGTKFYWLRGYNYDVEGRPSGTLAMADFPTGANEVTLAPAVGLYSELPPAPTQGLTIQDRLVAGRGNLQLLRDRGMPGMLTPVLTNVAGAKVSPDARWVLFVKEFDEDTFDVDAWVARLDGTAPCSLSRTAQLETFGPAFPPRAERVFWADKVDPLGRFAEGWMANPDGCGERTKFADAVDFWFFGEPGRMIFSDAAAGETVRLRHATFGPGGAWPQAGAVTIAERVARVYALVGAQRDVLLYTRPNGMFDDGVYLYGPLPR